MPKKPTRTIKRLPTRTKPATRPAINQDRTRFFQEHTPRLLQAIQSLGFSATRSRNEVAAREALQAVLNDWSRELVRLGR